MTSSSEWVNLLSCSVRSLVSCRTPADNKYIILDTAMGSENSGDHVIMDACEGILNDLIGTEFPHIATHYYSSDLEMYRDRIKFLCGTNILYTHMKGQGQWALSKDLFNNRNVCLFGVGMSDIGVDDSIDVYTKLFYRTILSRSLLHSVRDEMTRQRLLEAGIHNVLNTACPTMWSLTPDKQRKISCFRSRSVVTSITDYCFDASLDLKMLEYLSNVYDTVTIWIQGSHDVDWCLDRIIDKSKFRLIGPNLSELDHVIETEDFDYIGTRLHAGIRCLNGGHRSLIVAIDNRARQIGRDTGLPVVEREEGFINSTDDWVNHPVRTEIELPWNAIEQWKKQFL